MNCRCKDNEEEGNYITIKFCSYAKAANINEILVLQHWSNLQFLSLNDNISKGNRKTPEGERLCKQLLNRDWDD